MRGQGTRGAVLRSRAVPLGLLAILASTLSAIGPAPVASAEPAILRLDAQPLGIGEGGVVATGLARANRIRIQYAGGCNSLKLGGRAGERRFAVVVKRGDGRCAREAVQRGWVRAFACAGGQCAERQIRIARFRDSDGDSLNDLLERWVYRTLAHNPDSDSDRLRDPHEIFAFRTDPRNSDSDGDGLDDGQEARGGSDPKDAASPGSTPMRRASSGPSPPAGGQPPEETPPPPPPPPPDTKPPQTSLISGPSGTVTTATATFIFSSSEPGSTFACNLDGTAWVACPSPRTYSGLANGQHTFQVRATDKAGNTDPTPSSRIWTVAVPPPEVTCVVGATNVASAATLRSEVAAGHSVCVTAAVGGVDLRNLGNRSGVVVSSEGAGSMGFVDLGGGTTDLIIRSARFRSIELNGAHRTTLLGNTIGGTPEDRVLDQLIFMPGESNDVTIEDNDIGWTKADNSGNTGYGCRCYGELNGLRFVGNRVHDVAGDGFQGVGGSNVVIDRNEIGPVGANPDSDEHSDNIQLTHNGPNLQVTNNWIHHQGYYEGNVTGNSGSVYIHGGASNALLFENNLIETAQGRTEICGLGTGGTSRSSITIRGNTWVDGGLAFSGFPGFEWDCDSGTGNAIERNIAVDPDGGFAQEGPADVVTLADNLWGQPELVSLDPDGNCTSANCNPAGQGPIGYRKPSGVNW